MADWKPGDPIYPGPWLTSEHEAPIVAMERSRACGGFVACVVPNAVGGVTIDAVHSVDFRGPAEWPEWWPRELRPTTEPAGEPTPIGPRKGWQEVELLVASAPDQYALIHLEHMSVEHAKQLALEATGKDCQFYRLLLRLPEYQEPPLLAASQRVDRLP